jgi:preprotein translocase subunit YajC
MKHVRITFLSGVLLAVLLGGATAAWAQDAPKVDPTSSEDDAAPTMQAAGSDEAGPAADAPKGEGDEKEPNAEGENGEKGKSGSRPQSGLDWKFLAIVGGGFILLYVFMGSSRRKQQKKRREMLENIKKGDKVITIGGIVGNVVEVRDDEITVKVDDTTRMRFARWALRNAGEEVKTEKKEDSQTK